MIFHQTPYSRRPLVSAANLVVVRTRSLDATSSIRYNFAIFDRTQFKGGRPPPTAEPITSGHGFVTLHSCDEAVRVASRRVQGMAPAKADPTHTTPECRALLARLVDATWGE